jgi:hypothetical protein
VTDDTIQDTVSIPQELSPSMTDEEFAAWKETWDGELDVPEQVSQYLVDFLVTRPKEAWEKLLTFVPKAAE